MQGLNRMPISAERALPLVGGRGIAYAVLAILLEVKEAPERCAAACTPASENGNAHDAIDMSTTEFSRFVETRFPAPGIGPARRLGAPETAFPPCRPTTTCPMHCRKGKCAHVSRSAVAGRRRFCNGQRAEFYLQARMARRLRNDGANASARTRISGRAEAVDIRRHEGASAMQNSCTSTFSGRRHAGVPWTSPSGTKSPHRDASTTAGDQSRTARVAGRASAGGGTVPAAFDRRSIPCNG